MANLLWAFVLFLVFRSGNLRLAIADNQTPVQHQVGTHKRVVLEKMWNPWSILIGLMNSSLTRKKYLHWKTVLVDEPVFFPTRTVWGSSSTINKNCFPYIRYLPVFSRLRLAKSTTKLTAYATCYVPVSMFAEALLANEVNSSNLFFC